MQAALLMIPVVLLSCELAWSLPAFPGAEGWGANSVGGRGGQVIHVTNLNAYGPGSLEAAMGTAGPKIIVFDTGGVIDLGNSPLGLTPYTYIAGQTAPGGITLIRGGLYGQANDLIIRFIRIRGSAFTSDGDCFRLSYVGSHDIMLDHCSGMWCCDEILDMSYNCYNITIQSCVIAEPLQCHAYFGCDVGCGNNRTGILSTENDGRITFYKMIMAHSMKRNPYCTNGGKTAWQGKTYELINNVFYNCMAGSGETFDYQNNIPVNLIGNYYKGGLSADYGSTPFAHAGTFPQKCMIAYVDGNFHVKYPTLTQPGAFFNPMTVVGFRDSVISPLKTANILTAQEAYNQCVANSGVLPRDSAERRLMNEIVTKTGKWVDTCVNVKDPYMQATGLSPVRASLDTDRDGMPDTWETAHSLNPNSAADRTTDMGGYNAVEVYLNELADSIITTVAVEKPAIAPVRADKRPSVTASPNPLNSDVRFTLAGFNSTPVEMAVYDAHGRQVHSARFFTAMGALSWNGLDGRNRAQAAGIYLVRFVQGKMSAEKRVTLIR